MRKKRPPAPDWLALGLLLFAAGLRFWELGGPSFWYDEAYSWWLGTQITAAASLASSLIEFVPPGTYLIWRVWAALVGTSEFALRAISALPGVIAVAAAARAASLLDAHRLSRQQRRHSSRPPLSATHIALFLTAIAPPLLSASRTLRMYSLLLAFMMLGNAALLEVLLGTPRRRRAWAWLWGAMTLAALYTVVLAGAWLIGLGVFFLAVLALEPERGPMAGARRSEQWALVRALAPPALVAAALYLPWLIPALRQLGGNRGYWAGTLPLAGFFARTVQGITLYRTSGSEITAQRIGAAIAAFAVVAPVLTMSSRQTAGSSRQTAESARQTAGATTRDIPAILRTPLLWVGRPTLPRHLYSALFTLSSLLPPMLLMGLAVQRLPKWNLHHTVIFAPPLYLSLATVAATLAQPRTRTRHVLARAGTWTLRLALLGVTGLLAVASFNQLTHPALANDDWRGLTAFIHKHREPDELVILRPGWALPSWRYYAGPSEASESASVVLLPDDPLLDVTHVLDYATVAPVLSERLPGATGAWVVGYLAGVTDPTDIVDTLLEDAGTRQDAPHFHGLTLRHYSFDPAPLPATFSYPEQPALTSHPDVELLPGLRLWGFTFPAEAVPASPGAPADQSLRIRTWWTTPDPEAHEGRVYQASLRVVDAAGNTWAQHDAPPGGGDYRPERWSPTAGPVLGRFDVALLPGTPSGIYTATLILYEIGGPSSPAYTLGPLRVGRSMAPPPVPATYAPALRLEGDAPLDLLGIGLSTTRIAPCDALTGSLFWEVRTAPRLPYLVEVSLGAERVQLTPISAGGSQGMGALQPGERFQTQFRLPISCRALDTDAAVEIGLVMPGAAPGDPGERFAAWSGPEVEIAAGRVFDLPLSHGGAPIVPLDVHLGTRTEDREISPIAALLGYSLAAQQGPTGPRVPAGKPFTLNLYWRAEQQTDIAYTVFVHATPVEAPGPVLAQHDGWPGLGEKPTWHWVTGEVVADPHPIPALGPGTYALRAGLYGPDGERLVTADGDAVVVAIVTVR